MSNKPQKQNNNKELSARLMAVQACYQGSHNDKPIKIVVQEYLERGLDMDVDDEKMVAPHGALFKRILLSLDQRLAEVNDILKDSIVKKELPQPVIETKTKKIIKAKANIEAKKEAEAAKEAEVNVETEKSDSDLASDELPQAPPPVEKELEPLLKAILLCGICEILAHQDIDAPLIIDDYLNVTHAFYEQPQVSFVNGVLGKVAPLLRA